MFLVICDRCKRSKFIAAVLDVSSPDDPIKTLPQVVLLCTHCGDEAKNIEVLLVSPGEIVENFDRFYNAHYSHMGE